MRDEIFRFVKNQKRLYEFGEVNTGYMLSLLPDKSREEMLQDLHERI